MFDEFFGWLLFLDLLNLLLLLLNGCLVLIHLPWELHDLEHILPILVLLYHSLLEPFASGNPLLFLKSFLYLL